MNRKLVSSLVFFLLLSGIVILGGAGVCGQSGFSGVTLSVNQYGLVTELKNADGSNYFGKGSSPINDGYAIVYQSLDSKTRQPLKDMQTKREDFQLVYATNKKTSTDNLKVITGNGGATGFVKPDSNGESLFFIELQTADSALLLTQEFGALGKKREFGIRRRIKNISNKPVRLLAVEVQSDARFFLPKGMHSHTSETHLTKTAQASSPLSSKKRKAPVIWQPAVMGPWSDATYATFKDWCPPDLKARYPDRIINPSEVRITCADCAGTVFLEAEFKELIGVIFDQNLRIDNDLRNYLRDVLFEKLKCESYVVTSRFLSPIRGKKLTTLLPGEQIAVYTTPRLIQ